MLAGWLFADLMLVLFIVGLGTQPTAYLAAEAVSTPTASPSPSPVPSPTPELPPTLSKEAIVIPVDADFEGLRTSGAAHDSAAAALRDQVSAGLAANGLTAERAGMVLLFSHHESPSEGVARSAVIAAELPAINGGFFGGAAMRHFWDGASSDAFNVELEIYVIE